MSQTRSCSQLRVSVSQRHEDNHLVLHMENTKALASIYTPLSIYVYGYLFLEKQGKSAYKTALERQRCRQMNRKADKESDKLNPKRGRWTRANIGYEDDNICQKYKYHRRNFYAHCFCIITPSVRGFIFGIKSF